MRILYIAFENPALYTILNGMHDDELGGLPAFYHPFKMLLERGNTIDVLLISDHDFDVVPSDYFNASNLNVLKIRNRGLVGSVEIPLRMLSQVRKLLKERHYGFVYGMGEGAYPGIAVANKMGVPCALRQFGTQEMANVLETIPGKHARYIKALKEYPYITLSMLGKMSFLLATNDGSRADELYDILGVKKKKFPFFFWRSGVNIPQAQPVVDFQKQGNYPQTYDSMALSMINRIADVKRQDRAVQILEELHRRGYHFHIYFVGTGSVPENEMYQRALSLAQKYNLIDYVHFEGGKSQNECHQYARNSFATLMPCEWNRVNIFYELMGEGSVVATNDNHSIDEFIEDGVNCIVYEEDNFAQAAEKIISLMDDPEKNKAIRAEAYRTAKEKFMSLEKRFGMEAQLVEDVAKGKDLSRYPIVL